MSQNDNSSEKVIFVGDSRVKKKVQNTIPQDYATYPGKSEAFVPNFLLKEWMVGSVFIIGFMALVVAHPSPLGYPADPLNSEFIPMPDWYFLFLYQLLKYPYMAEQYVVFGTVVLPGLMFGALTIAPFLDTGKERRFYKRPIATGLMFLSLAAIIHLTYVSWSFYQSELERQGIIPEHIEREQRMAEGRALPPRPGSAVAAIPIVDAEDEGFSIYKRSTCIACHSDDLKGVAGMPSLLGIGNHWDRDELYDIIINGILPRMPAQYEGNIALGLTDAELETMADWLAKQKRPVE